MEFEKMMLCNVIPFTDNDVLFHGVRNVCKGWKQKTKQIQMNQPRKCEVCNLETTSKLILAEDIEDDSKKFKWCCWTCYLRCEECLTNYVDFVKDYKKQTCKYCNIDLNL